MRYRACVNVHREWRLRVALVFMSDNAIGTGTISRSSILNCRNTWTKYYGGEGMCIFRQTIVSIR